MKAITRAIDRFCIKHRNFGIPRLMIYIVFGTAVVFMVGMMDTTNMFFSYMAFIPGLVFERGEVWRLITWVFCPFDSSILNTALTLYFYYFIGTTLEREWGSAKFTLYYLAGILINIIYSTAAWYVFNDFALLTPGFLNLSMFFVFALMFPEQVILLFFIIPVKIKWLALINGGVFAFSFVRSILINDYITAFLPVIALVNLVVFCWDGITSLLRPAKYRHTRSAINFKKAARQAKRSGSHAQYRHKCAVCGVTDSDSPGTEFRYCSRCAGYHCFCSQHINNHIHFQ